MSSPGEIPVGFRFSAPGIDDTISRIKQLHEELNRGEITTKEYRGEMREVTTTTRAATQEFNQIKGAVFAANPTLLEFTKTMSGFSAVAQTGLGITTALNIAMLNTSQSSNALQDLKTKYADVTLEVDKLSKAFGINDVRTQAAISLQNELKNQIGSEQQKVLLQTISNWVTFGSALVLSANQGIQLVGMLKTLNATINPLLVENFAVGLSGVGRILFTWLGPIALVIAGVEGIYQLIKLLDPAFGEAGRGLEKSIIDNWHVGEIEAALLAPFVAFAGGVVDMANIVHANFVNLFNGILTDFINPLIVVWDSTIGKITGSIAQIPTQFYHVPSRDDILKGFGLGSPLSPSTSNSADAINQILVGSPTSSATAINSIQQTANYSSILTQGQQTSNQYLNSILTANQAANQVAQQQLNAINQQKAAQDELKTALQTSITNQTQKISDLQKQLEGANALAASHASKLENRSGTVDDLYAIQAANNSKQTITQQITDAKNTLQQLQSKSQGLDNATSGLGPVLSSIGLSSDTGIGSIISGALGDAAGIGGAGISAGELQEFVNTHDFGVFTRAAIRDNTVKTPTDREQIDALASANAKNLGIDLATHPYLVQKAHDTLLKGHVIKAASGFEGMVSGPTQFLAGEAGPEFVNISPSSRSAGNTTNNIHFHIEGSVIAYHELDGIIQESLKLSLRRAGFT